MIPSTPSRLTLGTAQLGLPYGIANREGLLSDEAAEAILERAFALGVRSLDTAPDYGEAEARIGAFLERRGRPEGLVLCTKLPRLDADLSADELADVVSQALDGSRQRLRVDCIDVYLIHAADDLRQHGQTLVDVLVKHGEAGHLGRFGVSVYEPEEGESALTFSGLSAIQYPFNSFDRRFREQGFAQRLNEHGHASFARSPLLQGLLLLEPERLPSHLPQAKRWLDEWSRLLSDYALDPLAAALGYAVECSGARRIVLGVESIPQIESAVDAVGSPLPDGFSDEVGRRLEGIPREVFDPRSWADPTS